jgi:hypothetical protein
MLRKAFAPYAIVKAEAGAMLLFESNFAQLSLTAQDPALPDTLPTQLHSLLPLPTGENVVVLPNGNSVGDSP